ncbi:luc7-like protein 3 [Onthophagus taurus]|uniref:luc7-like protein 3 n=1 Tax=Onthophagus taurus TaxID=166361 RepID=UPI0039BE2D1E
MAVFAAAQLLDELMGRNRNVAPNEKVKELNWEDPEYCKYYLVKFCPHDLFVNTRADLGSCAKVHDEEARKMFNQAKTHRKIHYQEEFIRFCTSMLNEVERKIQKGKQRLALSGKGELNNLIPAQNQRNSEQIDLLTERINGLVEEAEQAGTDGNVEQAQGLMKLCDQLKEERDALQKQGESNHWSTAEIAAAQEKQMEVCEVCGAFLIVGDAQQRIDDHLMGKQHVGYAKLKLATEEITSVVQTAREERRGARSGGLGSTPTVDDRRDRTRDRDRERSREKNDRSEHRSDRDISKINGESRDWRDKEEKRDRYDRNRRSPDRERDRLERRERDRSENGRDKKERKEKDRRERDRDRKHRSDRDSGKDRSSRHSHRR